MYTTSIYLCKNLGTFYITLYRLKMYEMNRYAMLAEQRIGETEHEPAWAFK